MRPHITRLEFIETVAPLACLTFLVLISGVVVIMLISGNIKEIQSDSRKAAIYCYCHISDTEDKEYARRLWPWLEQEE